MGMMGIGLGMMEREHRECGARSRSRKKFEPGTEAALGQCAAALCAVEHAQPRRGDPIHPKSPLGGSNRIAHDAQLRPP